MMNEQFIWRIEVENAGNIRMASWRSFIDWGQSPHPARTAASGASLIALRTEHPDAQRVQRLLKKLGLDLPVQSGAAPALVATIDGPRGRVELR